ncbi:MAG: hypothetical protein HY818_01075 [Acetobacterium woodii]|nr:hypothetical protein [Acetobacterium woodii]
MDNNEFVIEYINTTKKFNIQNEEQSIALIQRVSEYAMSKLAQTGTINCFFADHGWPHSCRLAVIAGKLLSNIDENEKKKYCQRAWNEIILLIWTAIALHDIGMTKVDADYERKDLECLIKEQSGRVNHVEKSGEWIDKLIEDIDQGDEETKKFTSEWNNYWQNDIDETSALRMVKDIVLMHGEDKNWLVTEKIGALDRNILDDLEESIAEKYKTLLCYAEGILCLSDLLDICPERMLILSNESLKYLFDGMEDEKKMLTYEHWVSHNIAKIDYSDLKDERYLNINVINYNLNKTLYLKNILLNKYSQFGALKDCLNWGNNEYLLKALEPFGYKGIRIKLARADRKKWNLIEEKGKSYSIYSNDFVGTINKKLLEKDNIFIVNSVLAQWVKQRCMIDKSMPDYKEVSSVYHLLQEGACIYLMYKRTDDNIPINGSKAFYVSLESGNSYDKSDVLLAALNSVYEISNNNTKSIYEVSITYKGSKIFSDLITGKDSDNKVMIYIIIIESCWEDDLDKIIETVNKKNNGSIVIFANQTSGFDTFKNENLVELIYNLDYKIFNKLKSDLNAYAVERWKGGYNLRDKDEKRIEELHVDETLGIGAYLMQLKTICNGIEVIIDEINADLENDLYSSLFIVNLFEMLSDNKRKLKKEELRNFYNEFCLQNKNIFLKFTEFEDAFVTLMKLCDINDDKIFLLEEYQDSFDKLIIESSNEMKNIKEDDNIKRKLFQMMIFFWLYNYHKVNFKSICFKEYLPMLSSEQLCGFILNENIQVNERINIAFESSEIIVGQLKSNKENSSFIRFMKSYMSDLTKDKNVLKSNEDFICFQAVYRIFRGILDPEMKDVTTLAINIASATFVGTIGFLEGVCSSNLKGDYFGELLKKLSPLLDNIFQNADNTIKYMAYDILYKYKIKELSLKYYQREWEIICEVLHNDSSLKIYEVNETIYNEWKKVRAVFVMILGNTSPQIRKRNEI